MLCFWLDIKQEPTESAWTILEVCGRDDLQSADEKLADTYAGCSFGTDRNQGLQQKIVKSNASSLNSLVRSSRLRSMSSKTSTTLIHSDINGEKKSLRGKGKKKKSCTAVEVGKPKVKRKKRVARSPKTLENGSEVGLRSRKVQSGKATNLSTETLIAIKNDENVSVAESQLLDGPDSAKKDMVKDKIKTEAESEDGDKETVLSRIPLKMRVKLSKKRWKSSK